MSSPAIAENSKGHEGRVVLSVGRPTGDEFKTEKHPKHNGRRFDSWEAARAYAFENGLLKRDGEKLTAEQLAKKYTLADIERMTEEMTGESGATRAVIRALYGDKNMGTEYWEVMTYTTLETFTQSAKLILGDATEIDGQHLEDADWSSIYEEFKGKK
ncbi:hypothetical protein [Streptomyces sp. NBC_00197]|uniref:hypothetical protein n=1 Tax=Streptomyces sp. NBC_00197 TaxID=2975676 RepID=UPI00324B1C49